MKHRRIRKCKGCGGDVTSRNRFVKYCYKCLNERSKALKDYKIGQPVKEEKFSERKVIQPSEYKDYINSVSWRKKSNALKENARCNFCFRSKKEVTLITHHKTYLRLGAEFPDDLIVICQDCHELFSANYVYNSKQGYHEPRNRLLTKRAPDRVVRTGKKDGSTLEPDTVK